MNWVYLTFDNHTDWRRTPPAPMTGKSSPSTFPAAAAAEAQQSSKSTSSRDTRKTSTPLGPAAPIRTLHRMRFEERFGPVGRSHGGPGSCRRGVLRGGAADAHPVTQRSGEWGHSDGPDADGGVAQGAAGADQN